MEVTPFLASLPAESMPGLAINDRLRPSAAAQRIANKKIQTELRVEIYSKSVVKAIGKVSIMKCS